MHSPDTTTKQCLFYLLRNILRADGGDLIIDLHIIVTYGVNIGTIVDSITNKVRYTVEQSTGLGVKKVNVFVDGMKE